MTAMALPKLGLGGAGIGNLYAAVSDAAAQDTVFAALGAGYGLVDTAPHYGNGLSELRLGAALKQWRVARPLLSSKVGRLLEPAAPEAAVNAFVSPAPFRQHFDYSRDGVRRSLDDSFARLGVKRLDIALIHDIGAQTHGAKHPEILRQVLDEALPTLHAARDAGQVGLIGLGVNEWQVCVEVLERAPLDVIMIAGRYTLFEQPALTSGMLDLCLERNVRVIAAGVFNSGLFAERPNVQSPYNYETAPDDVRARALALWQACERHGVAPQAAAVQFPFTHPAVTTVVVGARSPAEVLQAKAWLDMPIAPDFWTALRREGHLGGGE